MLSNIHLREEQEAIEKTIREVTDPYQKAMLKGVNLVLKLMHNIRTNQTAMMDKIGAERIKPKVGDVQEERR